MQPFRERWGTQPDGGEWLQERCLLFRFWPLRPLQFPFGLQSLSMLPLRFRAILFGFLGQFGSERVQGLLAIGSCFRHPCGLFGLFPLLSGGGEGVEVLRKVERYQRPLAVLKFLFGRPPLQQGFPLLRCQLPDASPAQVLFRCPLDALIDQAAVVHPRRVAVLLEVGVLYLGPPLSGFQEPFFRAGTVFPATSQLGMCPVVPFEILLGPPLDPVHHPFRVHEMGVRLFAPRQRRARIVDRPLVGVPFADLLLDEVQHQGLPLVGIQFARQGDFDFPVGRAVGPFVAVGGGLEPGRFMFGPRR